MIAFAGMLAGIASQVGMSVPDDPESYDAQKYPHFSVFCKVQLGSPIPYPSAVVDNAQLVASISDSEIMKVTLSQLLERGLQIERSMP